jgi:putative transposase
VTRHRHTESEIAAKLATADELAAQGVLHRDIARFLCISLMTYQRWRKARSTSGATSPTAAHTERAAADRAEIRQINELKIENLRLRRLVADLMLEKLELQENLQGRSSSGRAVERN